MEIRFDPRNQTLQKIQKKKDQRGQEKAFEEALQSEEGMDSSRQDSSPQDSAEDATRLSIGGKKAKESRKDDGKGLKVDLLA